MDNSIHQDIVLHSMFEVETGRDVSAFLNRELKLIGEQHDLPSDWVDSNKFERLVEKAGRLFIYAATACLFIGDDRYVPEEQLALLLDVDESEPNSQTTSSIRCTFRFYTSQLQVSPMIAISLSF